jgi:protein gp37
MRTPGMHRWVSFEPLLERIEWRPEWDTLDWVVVGGETGPGARPCNISHIADIVGECKHRSIPVFVKQLGARPICDPRSAWVWNINSMQDWRGADMAEWPEALRVREIPA